MRISTLCAMGLLGAVGVLCWPACSGADPAPAGSAADGAINAQPAALTVSTLPAGAGTDALAASPPASPGLSVPVSMPVADAVIVHKSERRLDLMRHGQVLRSYRISLGLEPQGAKERAGDFRTPEGHYFLTRRNPRSDYFLSILVSYPGPGDLARAHREHVDPGGQIMLHGLPNILRHKPAYYRSDWTDGCIALSDSDMVEVWLMTRDNTPIDILP